jgi:TPR repeat protein
MQRNVFLRTFSLFWVLAAVLNHAYADVAATDCDIVAASPSDHYRLESVVGVPMEELDIEGALAACSSAISKFPEVARFHYQLGRAYEASENDAKARLAFLDAAALGHAEAMYRLGMQFRLGKGGAANNRLAIEWWESAAAGRSIPAMWEIANLHNRYYAWVDIPFAQQPSGQRRGSRSSLEYCQNVRQWGARHQLHCRDYPNKGLCPAWRPPPVRG